MSGLRNFWDACFVTRWIGVALILLSLMLMIQAFAKSWSYTRNGGAVDFRNRVVACRQAKLGLNPYEYRWQAGESELLLDNHDSPKSKYSRMTSSPFSLLFFWPWCNADYRLLKWINFFAQWLAYLAIILLLCRILPRYTDKVWCIAVSGIYAYSEFWMYHVERGQQYVFFVLFALLGLTAKSGFRRVFFFVITVANRPPFFPTGTGVLTSISKVYSWKKMAMQLLIICLVFIALSSSLTKAEWWRSYSKAVQDWYRGIDQPRETVPTPYSGYPIFIEGDPTQGTYSNFDAPLNPYYRYSRRVLRQSPPFTASMIAAFVCLFIGSLLALISWRKPSGDDPAMHVLGVAAIIYLGDLVLPAPRGEYNNILILPVLGLILAPIKKSGFSVICASAMIGLVLFPWSAAQASGLRVLGEWSFILLSLSAMLRITWMACKSASTVS